VSQSEHGLSAVISQHSGEPLSITGPSPYHDTTEPLTAYCGIYRAPTGWWGIVVHRQRGQHPQDAIQHFEANPTPVIWCGAHATIGLYRLPTNQLVVSARIRESGIQQMKSVIAVETNRDFADSRFEKRRVPAGVRYLPGKQLQLWFSL
jgi:hypothetical protein